MFPGSLGAYRNRDQAPVGYEPQNQTKAKDWILARYLFTRMLIAAFGILYFGGEREKIANVFLYLACEADQIAAAQTLT